MRARAKWGKKRWSSARTARYEPSLKRQASALQSRRILPLRAKAGRAAAPAAAPRKAARHASACSNSGIARSKREKHAVATYPRSARSARSGRSMLKPWRSHARRIPGKTTTEAHRPAHRTPVERWGRMCLQCRLKTMSMASPMSIASAHHLLHLLLFHHRHLPLCHIRRMARRLKMTSKSRCWQIMSSPATFARWLSKVKPTTLRFMSLPVASHRGGHRSKRVATPLICWRIAPQLPCRSSEARHLCKTWAKMCRIYLMFRPRPSIYMKSKIWATRVILSGRSKFLSANYRTYLSTNRKKYRRRRASMARASPAVAPGRCLADPRPI